MSEISEQERKGLDVERLSKLLPIAFGCIYLTGFLVVTGSLAYYGVWPLVIFKLQYLIAGVWCLFPLPVLYLAWRTGTIPPLLLYDKNIASASRRQAAFTIATLLVIGVPIGLLLLFYRVLGFPLGRFPSWRANAVTVLLVVTAFLLKLAWNWVSRLPDARDLPGGSSRREVFRESLIGIATLVLLVYIACFSVYDYPLIPHDFGGGAPLTVVFVLSDNSGSASPFLVRDGNGPKTIPYKLLLEKENSLVVVSPGTNERAIEFDRKTISAMIVLKMPQ